MLDLRNWFDSLEVGQLGTQCSHGLRLLCLQFEIYFGATNKPIDRNLNSARLDCLCLLQQCVRPCLEEVHAHSGACLQRLFHSLFLVGFLCWAKLQFNNLRGDILSDSSIKHKCFRFESYIPIEYQMWSHPAKWVSHYQVIVIVHGESGYLSLHAQRLPLQLEQTFQLANRLAVAHIAAPQLCHLIRGSGVAWGWDSQRDESV